MISPQPDFYEVLGVSRTADQQEIKSAYHVLALKWHPDKNSSDEAAYQFRLIKEAYECLVDSFERMFYNFTHPEPPRRQPSSSRSGQPYSHTFTSNKYSTGSNRKRSHESSRDDDNEEEEQQSKKQKREINELRQQMNGLTKKMQEESKRAEKERERHERERSEAAAAAQRQNQLLQQELNRMKAEQESRLRIFNAPFYSSSLFNTFLYQNLNIIGVLLTVIAARPCYPY